MDHTDRRVWVIGLGGLLGRAIKRITPDAPRFEHPPLRWADDNVVDEINQLAVEFGEGPTPWSVMWCAGAGIIGTGPAELQRETEILSSALQGLRGARNQGTLVLASSAGGVYGGARAIPITEETSPRPLAEYGRNKLTQEALVEAWAEETGNQACAARIANLYGPGQRLTKPQGLISQICKAALLRQPISVYVSLDTLRDYLFVDDCAHTLLAMARRLRLEPPGTFVTRIVASGNSVSIGSLLGEVRRVLGRRPTVVMASSPTSSLQGSALSFRSTVWTETDHRVTPLAAGIGQTVEDMRRQIAHGVLLPTPR